MSETKQIVEGEGGSEKVMGVRLPNFLTRCPEIV